MAGLGQVRRCLVAALLALAVLPVAFWSAPVRAAGDADLESSPRAAGLAALEVARDENALLLSAQLDFALPSVVRDALTWGVPVYFTAEVDIVRPRWYWTDRHLARAWRYWRLSYLPLTRRWRLASSSEPLSEAGIGTGLAQPYDSLDEAVAALQRITGWRIAHADALKSGGKQTLTFSFQLDTSQLPRALQIGTAGQPDWRLRIERRIDLTQGAAP